MPLAQPELSPPTHPAAERRGTPRRRARDHLASPGAKPTFDARPALANLRLLVDDDLREAALALLALEGFLSRVKSELGGDAATPQRLAALAREAGPQARLEAASDDLARLQRRLAEAARVLSRSA